MSNTADSDGRARRVAKKAEGRQLSRPQLDMHSISKVSLSQVIGLVEAVDEMGGEADVAAIAEEVDMDLDKIGPIVDAAEFLGLLVVDDGDLRVTDLSRSILAANVKERKAMFREIIGEVPVFREVVEMARKAGRSLRKDEVLDSLSAQFGSHQSGDFFRALVYWGRYVELVQYDSASEKFEVRTPSP